MSYSLSAFGSKNDIGIEFRAKVTDFVDKLPTPVSEDDIARNEAVKDHLHSTIDAMFALGRAVGTPDDELSVTVSGHSNPHHSPVQGWADEFITISISRVKSDDEPQH